MYAIRSYYVFLAGMFLAPTNVTCDTILQERMPGSSIGKAFGFRDMVSKTAFGVAGILSGVVVDLIGARQLMVIVGLAALGYAAISPFLYADTSKLNLLRITSYNVCYTKLLRVAPEHRPRQRLDLRTVRGVPDDA